MLRSTRAWSNAGDEVAVLDRLGSELSGSDCMKPAASSNPSTSSLGLVAYSSERNVAKVVTMRARLLSFQCDLIDQLPVQQINPAAFLLT